MSCMWYFGELTKLCAYHVMCYVFQVVSMIAGRPRLDCTHTRIGNMSWRILVYVINNFWQINCINVDTWYFREIWHVIFMFKNENFVLKISVLHNIDSYLHDPVGWCPSLIFEVWYLMYHNREGLVCRSSMVEVVETLLHVVWRALVLLHAPPLKVFCLTGRGSMVAQAVCGNLGDVRRVYDFGLCVRVLLFLFHIFFFLHHWILFGFFPGFFFH